MAPGSRNLVVAPHYRPSRLARSMLQPRILLLGATLFGAFLFHGCKRNEEAAPKPAVDCKKQADCSVLGWCSSMKDGCGAATDADCTNSEQCKGVGRCTAVDGRCKATKSSDCAPTKPCRLIGACGIKDGSCEVVADADCAKSEICTKYGQCTARSGSCEK